MIPTQPCEKCGKDLPKYANYCPYCSAVISDRQPIVIEPDFVHADGKLKYFYDDVAIATTEEDASRFCAVGDTITLWHEKDNQYDPNAIVLHTLAGKKIGYLYKGKLQQMVLDFFNRNRQSITGKVVFNDIENNKITISLAFYKEITLNDCIDTFKIHLSKKRYEEEFEFYQDSGDALSVDYDYEKECYFVEDWGKLPKSKVKYAENDGYEFVFLGEEENDNGSADLEIGILEVKR